MRRIAALAGVFLLCVAVGLPAQAAKKKPRYFVIFRETLESPGLTTGLKDKVKPLLIEALRTYPEFVLELPDAPQNPEELEKYLKKNGLKGYELNLRLTKLTQSVAPPKPGEPFKTLSVTIGATIFGTSFPQKSFAIGGDGESTVAIPVRNETPKDVEAAKNDALKDAIQQAIAKALRSFEIGQMTPKPEKRKKK
jgi:hypothetical protein